MLNEEKNRAETGQRPPVIEVQSLHAEQDDSKNDDELFQRAAATRVWSKISSLFLSSRGLSSAAFIALMFAANHCMCAADTFINNELQGRYDALFIAFVENLIMIFVLTIGYVLLARRGLINHAEWYPRCPKLATVALGVVFGGSTTLWAASSQRVTRHFYEGSDALVVIIVFIGRYGFQREEHHIFHLIGGLYATLGLLTNSFSTDSVVSAPSISDTLFLLHQVMWAVLLLSLAAFFEKNPRMSVIGFLLGMVGAELIVTTVALVSFTAVGEIQGSSIGCLVLGLGCSSGVPAALIGHSLTVLIRLFTVTIITKFVGAPLCAVAGATSSALLFYQTRAQPPTSFNVLPTTRPSGNFTETPTPTSSFDRGAVLTSNLVLGFMSLAGCFVFTHGQWLFEETATEKWEAQLRRQYQHGADWSGRDSESAVGGEQERAKQSVADKRNNDESVGLLQPNELDNNNDE